MNVRSSAVTVIELLITVIVVGILAAIALPALTRSVEIAKGREAETTLRAIFDAERAYAFDQTPNHYGTLTDLESGRYLPGNLSTLEWSYDVALGSPNTTYTATATRLRGPYLNYRRRTTEAGAAPINTLPPTGDTAVSQSWPP